MRFRFIDAERAGLAMPIFRLCGLLQVSVSGFYAWRNRGPSQRQLDDMVLLAHVRAAFRRSRESYGAERVHHELAENGIEVGRHRVARLMRGNGLSPKRKQKFKKTTDSQHNKAVASNLLDQNFSAEAPNEKWAADISYIWTAQGWLYLAVMLDLYSRRVIGWAVGRYRAVIITCHRRPYASVLTATGLDKGCIVECPYFSEKEAGLLVSAYGGNPKVWGRLAHIAGGFGHPQLTHAFVNGMAAREWPSEEIQHILSQGLSSDDIDAARDSARRNLVSALPDGTRNLLYRLSLTFGRFDRSLALTLAEIPPPVHQSGETIDQLIGPWIEEVGKDLFRVSPLVSGSGGMMLPPDKQRLIHDTISLQMLGRGTINASDIDAIFMHAMAGKSVYGLTMIAHISSGPIRSGAPTSPISRCAAAFSIYLVAIMDWATRHVLAWRLSNSMDTRFCLEALNEALTRHGRPEIFNTDQGSQFTSLAFTDVLKEAGVAISMDGRGRWMDNIFIERLWRSLKYEAVYLHELTDGFVAERVIGEWVGFYNTERPHSSLGGQTPAEAFSGEAPVDMMDKPDGLPTSPPAQQQQQENINLKRNLAA